MITFITTLAYIFGTVATFLIFTGFLGKYLCSERDKMLDNLRGFEKHYPVFWPIVISTVCWVWVYTV